MVGKRVVTLHHAPDHDHSNDDIRKSGDYSVRGYVFGCDKFRLVLRHDDVRGGSNEREVAGEGRYIAQ